MSDSSNISNIAKALKQGALNKNTTKKKKNNNHEHKNDSKLNIKPVHKKSKYNQLSHRGKVRNQTIQKRAKRLDRHENNDTKVSLRALNSQLRPAKRLQSKIGLRNEFNTYPIMPDLLTYCRLDASHNNLPVPDKKSATLQLLTHSNGMTLGAEQQIGLLRATQSIHLQMPTYLSNALKQLTKMIRNIQRTDYGYSSLKKLRHLIMSNIEDFRFNINKSSIIMLLLMGVLKPDKKLKHDLFKQSIKNEATSVLVNKGYLTPISAKKISYTTISAPLDLSLWLNLAEVNLMKKFTNLDKDEKFYYQIASSCRYLRSIDGGIVFRFNNYLSSFTNLINFKLQQELLNY